LSVRKGLVAKRLIAEGEALGLDNVRFAWPPLGISVEHWDVVVTRRAARTIRPNEIIDWPDVRLGR
jgi:sialic acid synthase SpsE